MISLSRSIAVLIVLGAASAKADPAVVEDVTARLTGDTWTFSVTLSHADTGWDDYADGWRVEGSDGTVLGYRELFHPHVDEQPFTRSLSGVAIPDGLTVVQIRARTNVDGWDSTTLPFRLPDG